MTKKEQVFNWGDTPAVMTARVDYFISAPVWFDALETDGKYSMYAQLGLPMEHRTDRLKRWHVIQAMPEEQQWRKGNLAVVAGHLLLNPESTFHLVDGYPEAILNAVMEEVLNAILDLDTEPADPYYTRRLWGNRTVVKHTPTLRKFKNQIKAIENPVDGYAFVNLSDGESGNSNLIIPEANEYNVHLSLLRQTEWEKMSQAQQAGDEGGVQMSADPMTQEEIDQLIKDGKGDKH